MYFIIIGAVLLALIFLHILISYIAYRYVFARDKRREPSLMKGLVGKLTPERERKRELIGELGCIPSEDVFITSHDGLRLRAMYLKGQPDRPVAIGFHGYRSSALRDLAGLATYYYYRGYDVLLVDERAHGESEGRCITFGAKERLDVLSWARYAEETFGAEKKIILFGMSMGAASVLLATELDLPRGVIGAVADCPFSSASGIIAEVSRSKGIPTKLLFPAIRLGARAFGGFNLSKTEPAKAVRNSRIPILLIHGTGDTFVPHEMSDELARVGKDIDYVKISGAPHLLSMMCDEEKYTAALDCFNKKILDLKEDL
jgi:pimeloyl-ACP methyl ester carboxylesterase